MQEISIYDKNGNILTELVQWDKNVYIKIKKNDIEKSNRIHFFNCNSKEAMVVEARVEDGFLSAPVPNDILMEPHTIAGYVWLGEEDGTKYENEEHKSAYCFKIIVRKRPKPSDYVYENQKEYITFEKVLAEAQKYVEMAELHKTAASASASTASAKANEASTSAKNAANSANIASEKEASANAASANAEAAKTAAHTSAINAANSAKESESYTHGGTGTRIGEDTDNSEFYSQKSKEYSESWRGSLLPMGQLPFGSIPVDGNEPGHLYDITDAFISDERFKDGAGYSYPAGTNIFWTKGGKWDVLYGKLTKELTQSEYDALPDSEKINGTIYYISDADNAIPDVSDSESGFMSPEDKSKLDSIQTGAEANIQADWSENDPASDAYINNKPASLPASDVYSWAKASTKPSYTYSEVGADKSGAADAALSNAKSYIDTKVADLINDSTGMTHYQALTQAQYDALTDAQKNNGTIYFITDAN